MKRIIILTLIFVAATGLSHILALNAAPRLIMGKVLQAVEDRGKPNQFKLAPRATPETQTVVRPSPDLAYSICLFDFSKTTQPMEIVATAWENYASVSFFDAETNNFATVRVNDKTGLDKGAKILLRAPGADLLTDRPADEQQIEAPTKRGIILIRRLAPSLQMYALVSKLSKADKCRSVNELSA